MFFKKGQGLPMNTIVIVILALIVLAVVGWIFSNQSGIFVKNINSCSNKGGTCMVDRGNNKCYSNETILYTPDCKYVPQTEDKDKDGQCCIPVLR